VPRQQQQLTRRAAIRNAVALLGGTVTAAQLGPLASAVAAINGETAPRFLSEAQFEMVGRIVDLVIPETDTAGAFGAGVHRFIDMMLADWASAATRKRYVEGLGDIDRRAGDFSSGSRDKQTELLLRLDREAFAADSGETFFKDLKTLILFGYYSSEEGASAELRFDRLPGAYRSCVPYDEIGRSWST
jgi:hypothetical protein